MRNLRLWQTRLVATLTMGSFMLLAGVLPARAEAVQIEVAKPGIYSLQANQRVGSPPVFLEATTVVPAEVGTEFGFEFIRLGMEGAPVLDLTLVTEFPVQGIIDPDTQQTVYRDEHSIRSITGLRGYQGYKLDSPAELALGTWTFKILYRDQLLASQSFTLVSP